MSGSGKCFQKLVFLYGHYRYVFFIVIYDEQIRKQGMFSQPEMSAFFYTSDRFYGNDSFAHKTPVIDNQFILGSNGVCGMDDAFDYNYQKKQHYRSVYSHFIPEGQTGSYGENHNKDIHCKMYACMKNSVHY